MALFSLLARLGLDTTGFELGLKRSQSQATKFAEETASKFKGFFAAAFGIAAMEQMVHRTMEYASQLTLLSRRLDVSTETLQEFGYAAGKTRTNLEAFTGALEKINVARDNALDGGAKGDKLVQSFKDLGVSIEDLKTKRAEDIIRKIGRALAGGDAQSLVGSLRDVAGRGVGELIPALRQLDALSEKARQSGMILADKDIERLHDAEMRLKRINALMRPFVAKGTSRIAEAVEDVIEAPKTSPIGNIARFFGGFSVGGFSAGFKAVFQPYMDALDAKKKREEELSKRDPLPRTHTQAEADKTRIDERISLEVNTRFPSATARQAIGAFQALGPSISTKRTETLLEKIEKNTRHTADGASLLEPE